MCDEDSILSVFTHLKKIHVARLLPSFRYLRQHKRIARLVTIGWTLLQRCIGGYVEWTMYSEHRCSLKDSHATIKWLILYCIVHYIVSRGRIWTQPQCPWSVRAALLVRPSCQMYAFHSFIQRVSAWLYILHTALHSPSPPEMPSHLLISGNAD